MRPGRRTPIRRSSGAGARPSAPRRRARAGTSHRGPRGRAGRAARSERRRAAARRERRLGPCGSFLGDARERIASSRDERIGGRGCPGEHGRAGRRRSGRRDGRARRPCRDRPRGRALGARLARLRASRVAGLGAEFRRRARGFPRTCLALARGRDERLHRLCGHRRAAADRRHGNGRDGDRRQSRQRCGHRPLRPLRRRTRRPGLAALRRLRTARGWSGADPATLMELFSLPPDELERRHDELNAALDELVERDEPEMALGERGLIDFWMRKGHLDEGRRQLDRLLAAGDPPANLRAAGLYGAGVLAFRQGDEETARRLFEESEELARSSGDDAALAAALGGLSRVALRAGDPARTRELALEALELVEGEAAEYNPRHMLAAAARAEGDYVRAEELYGETLALSLRLGLLAAAKAAFDRTGAAIDPGSAEEYEAMVAHLGHDYEAAWAEGSQLSLDEAVARARRARPV